MITHLKERVIDALKAVLDPETSLDVWRMRLIRDLEVTQDGDVSLVFRPSSVLCPLGYSLGARIKKAVLEVEGVRKVCVKVEGFVHAQQLEHLLSEIER